MVLNKSSENITARKPKPLSKAQRFVNSHRGVTFKLRPNGKPTYSFGGKTFSSQQAVSMAYKLGVQ
jgi:hypothetical protein